MLRTPSFRRTSLVAVSALWLVACQAGSEGGAFEGGSEGAGGDEAGAGGSDTTSFGDTPAGCVHTTDADEDADGWSGAAGDCNDCDARVNPGALDVVSAEGEPAVDENCNGTLDDMAAACDDGLPVAPGDAMAAAKAIELCKTPVSAGDWGVTSARFIRANGAAASATNQVGVLDGFGPNVPARGGSRMLALSSGRARTPAQGDACGYQSCYGVGTGTPPPGFPQSSADCTQSPDIRDDIGLEVVVQPPANATGYSFDFKFYSFEYPEFVCTSFNDQFIALVNPAPPSSMNGNISFDSNSNPVSVNIAFFDVCEGCAQGEEELAGTGFDTWGDAGATTWLQTTAPISDAGPITIRFAIWDTGDQSWDSTVLVDNFQWTADGGVGVGTVPVPE